MRTFHPFLFFVALGWLAAGQLGCEGEEKRPIRIGINPWPGYEFLYLAQEKGLFTQEGVPVRILEFSSLGDVRRAYERGQVDGMGCTLIEVLQTREHGARNLQVFYVCDFSDGGDVLLAGPEIKSVADLKGKRVGVEPGSVNVFLLCRALQEAGLTLKDVEIISMHQLCLERTFSRGEVDAVVTYPPVSMRLLKKEGVHEIFSSRQIPGAVVDVLAMDEGVIERRREDVERIGRAFDRAVRYSIEHPEESYGLMARREGIDVEEFERAAKKDIKVLRLGDQAGFFEPGGRLEQVIEETGGVMKEAGQIRKAVSAGDTVAKGFHWCRKNP